MTLVPWIRRRAEVTVKVLPAAVIASGVTLLSAPAAAGPYEVPRETSAFTEEFADPTNPSRAMMRLWMPLAEIDEDELRFALTDIGQKGFGGVEIGGFAVAGADAADYGWNSDGWNEAMKAALEIAAEPDIDLRLDFMVGASYPAATPSSYLTPDQGGSEKELAWGAVKVADGSTYSAPAPEALRPPAEGVSSGELVALVAARLLPGQSFETAELGTADGTTLYLDRSSTRVLDLPEDPADDVVFDAPGGDGDWVLMSYWLRGSGGTVPRITDPISYVIDHLSTSGTEAWTRLWEDELLADPEARDLVAKNHGYLFEDSLHLKSYQLWTEDFLEEFERRRGYDVKPFLPTLLTPDLNNFFGGRRNADTALGSFEYEPGVGQRIRNDYYQTLTDLYIEKHIIPMREWAARHGLGLRFQPSYGQSLEQSAAVFELDIPETESFQHDDQPDAYRYISAAAHASDRPVISTECCAAFGQANAFGWQTTLPYVEGNYAGGVNNIVFHGYSYNISPNATWPGWYRFGQNRFSENYGKQPTWQFVRSVADYLGRQQVVLRQGRQVTDVAVYRHSYWDMIRGGPEYYADGGALAGAGYSYGFVSPAMLALDHFVVEEGRLDRAGAGYRALILNDQAALPVKAAERLLAIAEAGLPIVFVGDLPKASPFFGETPSDGAIAAMAGRMAALANVVQVSAVSEVPGALSSLSVLPDAFPSGTTSALSVRRSADTVDYYYLFNRGAVAQELQYGFVGKGRPYLLDAWSGAIHPLAQYAVVRGRTTVAVRLEPGETAIIALSESWDPLGLDRLPHVISTDASEAIYTEAADLAVRAFASGAISVELSDGSTVDVEVGAIPRASLGGSWNLHVESWEQASDKDPYSIAKVASSHTLTAASDGTLPSWQNIAGLEDVSGTGTYTGRLTLPEEWADDHGVILDLGRVSDNLVMRVNDVQVRHVSPVNPRADISAHLHAGENEIEIEVGTTMRTRMRVISGPVATPSTEPRQDYGVFGPISVAPFEEVPLGPSPDE